MQYQKLFFYNAFMLSVQIAHLDYTDYAKNVVFLYSHKTYKYRKFWNDWKQILDNTFKN